MSAPFRWDLSRREQLGSLLAANAGTATALHDADRREVRRVAARVLAMSKGADLVFVGRTPENLFDYLSGTFLGQNRLPKLELFPFSSRWLPEEAIDRLPSANREGVFEHVRKSALSPARVAQSSSRTALVDFVAYGGTFQSLTNVMMAVAAADGVDWNAVQRRLVYVGLRARTKNSPNTSRWQQSADWLSRVPDAEVRNVSAEPGWIYTLANWQPKTTPPFSFDRWPDEAGTTVPRRPENIEALKLAVHLFDLGNTNRERRALAAELAGTFQFRHRQVRQIASLLRSGY